MTAPETPTWIACLTPQGQSALATLGLRGPRAWESLRKLFRLRSGAELPPTLPPCGGGSNTTSPLAEGGAVGGGGRFWLGRIGGEVSDEVVVAVKQIDPQRWLEVHCHGGREVVRFLIELFRAQGLQQCSWQDFLRKTSADSLSAEAAIALTHAVTPRTASILLDQQQGALGRALEAIRQALERGETAAAAEGLEQLARSAAVGRHLTQPWRVVVAGAPNVGKSSLVNAFAGYQRSIVATTPGTTRDVVTMRLALDGWLIELTDTAGQRTEAESLEEQGIRRARAMAASADLCLWLLDNSSSPVWPSEPLTHVQYVINKSDLPPAWDMASVPHPVRVSALTGAGLTELCSAVIARLIPDPPPPGAAVPFTSGLCEQISQAQRAIATGDTAGARQIVMSLNPNRARSAGE